MPHRRMGMLALAATASLVLAGCGGTQPAPPAAAGDAVTGEVTVFAAASLTESFTEIGKAFEKANPGATVQFNFAGSTTLAKQLTSGAPAGVFASANKEQMQKVVDAGLTAGQPTIFVANTLQIVVPKGNPAGITGLADFGKADLKIAICAKEVPCGVLSRQLFEKAGVTPQPDSLEQDVKAVLTKASLGEIDAGLVYRTDVASAGDSVEGIDFPEAKLETNQYPIVVMKNAPNAAGAKAFVDFVLSAEGKAVMEKFGFITNVPS
ncbi:MAG: molybdate ABC transporter substrate-binding protein [Pseudonocardia sp.]|nr:molybdate ABC transporter substrate-binding protein [Pseudonocardia sp.]